MLSRQFAQPWRKKGNAETVRRILEGEDRGPRRDAVLLNSAAALVVADHAVDLAEGVAQARQSIDSGAARAKVQALARLTNA